MNVQLIAQHQDGWVTGYADEHCFKAKLSYNNSSVFGIGGGRILKLAVSNTVDPVSMAARKAPVPFCPCMMSFDRGWDIRPKNEEEKAILDAIVTFFDKAGH